MAGPWCPIVCSNTSLDLAVKVFVDASNIYNRLTLNKADFPARRGWALSNQVKALKEKRVWPPPRKKGLGLQVAFSLGFQLVGLP